MKLKWLSLLALGGALSMPAVAQLALDDEPPVEEPKTKKLELGSTVPESLSLTSLDGERASFKGMRGKVVIVHFWSDRCPAEKHADPVFKRLEGYYKEKDVVLIGIASNQNELGAKPGEGDDYADFYGNLRKKRDEVGHTHAIYVDHGNELSDLFQARTTPHCYVIDAKGVLRYEGALDDDPRGQKGEAATIYVKDAADALLGGKEVTVTSTKPYG